MRYVAILSLLAGCQLVFTIPDPPPIDAAPDSAPLVVKHIFVTSQFFNGNLGGIEGADEKCSALAGGAGLTGTYLAWLSTGDSSPASRMTQHPGAYRAIGEAPIAESWTDLASGTLLNSLRTDEHGEAAGVQFICRGDEVWSNTRFDGTFEIDSCDGWTSTMTIGSVGSTFYKDARWTFDPGCPSVVCDAEMPIFCVEQ